MAAATAASLVDGSLDDQLRALSLSSLTAVRAGPERTLSEETVVPEPKQAATSTYDAAGGAVDAIDGETRRTPPPDHGDSEAITQRFIAHLLDPKYADTQPQYAAIGYELEALVSIYSSASLKLSTSSRPASLHSYTSDDAALPPPIPVPSSFGSSSIEPVRSASRSSHSSRSSATWDDAVFDSDFGLSTGDRIRYEVTLPLWDEGDDLGGLVGPGSEPPKMRLLVSLPPTYPDTSPPQLQLLGRYLGSFSIDAALFGDITRTYIASKGVIFTPGDVCVFDGLTYVQQTAREWYSSHLAALADGDRQRQKDHAPPSLGIDTELAKSALPARPSPRSTFSYTHARPGLSSLTGTGSGVDGTTTPAAVHRVEEAMLSGKNASPTGLRIFRSEPIVEKRSTFIGHAVRVTDEREVPLVIHELLSDRKIAKATHPAIFAYRIAKDVGGAAGKIYALDNDDDGESQAGGRLAHLLDILDLENVLVVVSRWYGGTLLGPDRFKMINTAARQALQIGGFLVEHEKDSKAAKRR